MGFLLRSVQTNQGTLKTTDVVEKRGRVDGSKVREADGAVALFNPVET
jgi:hypothetical protein